MTRVRACLCVCARADFFHFSPPPSCLPSPPSLPSLSSARRAPNLGFVLKSGTALREVFFFFFCLPSLAVGRKKREPSSLAVRHTRLATCLIPLSTLTWRGSYQTLKVSSCLFYLFSFYFYFYFPCAASPPFNLSARTPPIVSTCLIGTDPEEGKNKGKGV